MLQSVRGRQGFTLIELMVTIAIAGLLILLVAPSFQDMIVMQRLRGVDAQLVTDLQFARAEAVARGRYVRINLGSDASQTCYVLYLSDGSGFDRCDCTLGVGSACPAGDGRLELKTVSVPRSGQVSLTWPASQDTGFAFDFVTGGLVTIPSDTASAPLPFISIDARVDDDRRLRTEVIQTGRPRVCAPNPERMGTVAC